MTNCKPYPAYKNSGEYWMGEIPEFWELRKLKHLFREKKITHNADLECGSISFGEIVSKGDEKVTEATKASYQEVLSGEFLINPLNLNYDVRSLRIGLSRINVVVSSGYIVLQNRCNLNKEYYRWLLHRYDVAYMKLLGSGVRQTISFNHIANSLLAFPPPAEQIAIADFLDDKTAKIDKAIAQKERLIALLKERKQIIIQNAVTKGLDPTVKMKDSGIEWIGEIPKHWEMKKLGHIGRVGNGSTPSRSNMNYWNKPDFPWLNSGSVHQQVVKRSNQFVSAKALKECHLPILKRDTIIIAITGQGKTRGTAAILEMEATINQHLAYVAVTKESVSPSFLHLALTAQYSRFRVISESGSTKGALTCQDIKDFTIPFPPKAEQEKLISWIESSSEKFENAIRQATQSIQKLREYRATLIDSAVTGKIKVPGI